jgi:hypothetical protein
MSSYTHKDQVLFPNAIPESLDNYEHKKKSITEGLTVDSDAGLDNAMASLMTEYVKDTKNTTVNKKEGMLTGTSLNLNLLQGDLFNYSRNDINKNPIQPFTEQLQDLDEKAGVVSYKEGLTNDDRYISSSTNGITSASKSQKLIDLENKLSTLTTEYTTQYRLYTDDLLTRSQFLQTNSAYLNKVVRDVSGVDASGSYYYVNPFGYTHQYKDLSAVLLYDDKTCPKIERLESITDIKNPYKLSSSSYIDISDGTTGGGFSRFSNLKSYDMISYTPCISAKNVKLPGTTASEDKFAWVDVEGKKHIYEAGVWPDKRHSSCLTTIVGEPITLTEKQYNSIPTADNEPMKENSECFRINVAPSIHSKLAEIKKNIDVTVQEIKRENQNILNSAANTTIIRRKKTAAEKLASIDDTILAKIKLMLGDYYYPVIYVFWCFIIFIAILIIFKFAFMFVTPGEGSANGDGNSDSGTNMSLLGVVIMSLIVIFAVYYYFSYTYNANTSYTITT